MAMFRMAEEDGSVSFDNQTKNYRDILTQFLLSVAFGLSAFLSFCVGIKFDFVFLSDQLIIVHNSI